MNTVSTTVALVAANLAGVAFGGAQIPRQPGSWPIPLSISPLSGPINCNNKGFFCLWTPTALATPADDPLRGAKNAYSCWNTDQRNDFHCHGSNDDNLYHEVMKLHYDRGYNGRLTCQCEWPPRGRTNRCDYSGTQNAFEDGCPQPQGAATAAKPVWVAGQNWRIEQWGNRYFNVDQLSSPASEAYSLAFRMKNIGIKNTMDMKPGNDGGNRKDNAGDMVVGTSSATFFTYVPPKRK